MKKIVLFLSVFFLITRISYCQNWQPQVSGTSVSLNDLYFINTNTGFAVGNKGVILKTTNGGINWNRINIGITNKDLRTIYCTDINTCYIGGGDYYYFVGGFHRDRILLKSTNQGLNWNILENYTTDADPIYDMQFINSNTGWYCCGTLLKTTDGGLSWQDKQVGAYESFFIDEFNGFRVEQSPYIMYRTSNDGQSWINVGNFYTLGGFSFTNSLTGYAMRNSGLSGIVKTTDGGFSWFDLYRLQGVINPSIHFSDNNNGFVVGFHGEVEKTNDGGITWNHSILPGGTLKSVFTLNDSASWTVGDSGRIFRTISLPNSILNISNSIPENFSLFQNYPNPFNPKTKLEFGISKLGFVSLKVFDMLGKEVAVLVNEKLNPGNYSINFNGESLPSGVYFYKLETSGFVETKRMVLLK